MQKLLVVLFLLFSQIIYAQKGYLYVKKHGFKKVRTFEEGSVVRFTTKDGNVVHGMLALIKKDSVLVNGNWFGALSINKIFLREKRSNPFDYKTFLLATGGVVLCTTGMTLANWADFDKALGYSAGIGYTNFLIRYFPNLKRKKYKIGKKFTLQTFDLHF